MTTRTREDDLKRLANADPVANPRRVTVLYGDYGKRKTTTACSMVKERGLLLSVDGSWDVLLNPRHRELLERVRIIELKGLSQLDYIDFDREDYDTIIWDPVTTSVAKYLDLLYDESSWGGKYRDKITLNSDASDYAKEELKDLATLAAVDYRVTRDKFRPAFEKIFSQNTHVIFTAHVTKPIPGLSQKTTAEPRMPTATFEILGERASIIANLRAASKTKFLADMTEGSSSFLGKSRIEGLQGTMDLDDFVTKYKEIVFK